MNGLGKIFDSKLQIVRPRLQKLQIEQPRLQKLQIEQPRLAKLHTNRAATSRKITYKSHGHVSQIISLLPSDQNLQMNPEKHFSHIDTVSIRKLVNGKRY